MSHFTEKELQHFCTMTAKRLVTIPTIKDCKNNNCKTRIIYPEYKHSDEQKDRISEQELRLCFCHTLEKVRKELYYAIEVPTKEKYKFSKAKTKRVTKTVGRSGNIDLCLYLKNYNKVKRDINIEFKHGNPTEENVLIDLLKLTNEHHSGVYYIAVNKVNNTTLSSKKESGLINKIISALTNDRIATTRKGEHLKNQFIMFSIVLPDHGKLLIKTLSLDELRNNNKEALKQRLIEILTIDYKVKDKKFEYNKKNKWFIGNL